MCGFSNRNVPIPWRYATHPAMFTRDSIPDILSLAERLSVNCQFFFDEKKKVIKFDACYKHGEGIAKIFWSKTMILLPLLYHMKQLPKRLVRVEMR